MKKKIRCEYCGYEIKGPEDIIYVEDQTAYYSLSFKKGELYYEKKDAEAWEFGQYVCGSCYSELPIHTEHEMIKYLKSISKKK
jgi:DNA-directed RNA polymerase subunit RPC12/RpoP